MTLTEEQMIERLRAVYDALNRGDRDAVMDWAHPEIVLVRAGGQPDVKGMDAVRAWLEPDAFESQTFDPLEFQVQDNRALVRVRGAMRGAGSGIEMEIESWGVWTFDDDGQITRSEFYLHHEEADARRAFEAD
jgi:ketosteroid isomerase-like protein